MADIEESSDVARLLFGAAIEAVQAHRLLNADVLEAIGREALESYERVVACAMGKAALTMASVLEAAWQEHITDGIAVVPEGYVETCPDRYKRPERIRVIEGGHPDPNEGSERAGREMLALADEADEDDLVVTLISGGGSALAMVPREPLRLDEVQELNDALVTSGADIHEVNSVRKHVSAIGGGQLAAHTFPAEVAAVAVSDVPGDELNVIASGPTVPDPSTFADALDVIDRYDVRSDTPTNVISFLEDGAEGDVEETPTEDHPCFDRSDTRLIGSNKIALEAAAEKARELGLHPDVRAGELEGEARDVGAQLAKEIADQAGEPICLISGGETTVSISGDGKGGRNQELALAAGLTLEEKQADGLLLSGGSDGIDGPTDAAGAWSSARHIQQAREAGLDPEDYLERNDSYHFFAEAGGLVKTGPTHTNVMDIVIGISSS